MFRYQNLFSFKKSKSLVMKKGEKTGVRKKLLLLAIIFSHFLPLVISGFYDKVLHAKHGIELSKPKFWFWFFMWWSAWTSLITIPWAIYKLCSRQKKSGFIGQLIDLVVVEANFLSGAIFC